MVTLHRSLIQQIATTKHTYGMDSKSVMESLRQASTSTIEDPIKHHPHPLLMGVVEWVSTLALEFQLESKMYYVYFAVDIHRHGVENEFKTTSIQSQRRSIFWVVTESF